MRKGDFMTDNVNENDLLPSEPTVPEGETPTTADNTKEGFIPIKYNKKIINLDLKRAGELAQKGMKLEAISKEIETLRELAQSKNQSISDYLNDLKQNENSKRLDSLIEKCGADKELLNEVLKLSEKNQRHIKGFDELTEFFPEIKSLEDLPESVVENVKLNGRTLLDEFLRYRISEEKAVRENNITQRRAEESSVGSQLNKVKGENPEAAEFLKGLWRK